MSTVHSALSLLLVGCTMGDAIDISEREDARLESDAPRIATSYQQFTLVNTTPYGSDLGAFNINVFVSRESAAAFLKIDPAVNGSNVELAPGAAIVRAVLDASNQPTKLTMMVKGPVGYDPSLGDWWFAVTDLQGRPINDEQGTPQMGRFVACHSCHEPRATDDYLFGVPAASKHGS